MQRSDLEEGRKYRVVSRSMAAAVRHCFDVGDVVVVAGDDGTDAPRFKHWGGGFSQFVHLSELEVHNA